MCTGAPGTARNRVKGVSRAAENSAFTELTVKFLELNHTNLHNYLKRLPSLHTYENDQDQAVPEIRTCTPCTRSPMSTQAPGGRPERAAERNRILEFSSKMTFNTLKY